MSRVIKNIVLNVPSVEARRDILMSLGGAVGARDYAIEPSKPGRFMFVPGKCGPQAQMLVGDDLMRLWEMAYDEVFGTLFQKFTVSDSKEIVFPKYMSDGPGYCGPLAFKIVDGDMTISRDRYARTKPPAGTSVPVDTSIISLHMNVPEVVEVSNELDEADVAELVRLLEPYDLEHLIDPETQSLYEDDRVRRLQFADGSKGFFIVWGAHWRLANVESSGLCP